MEVRHYNLLVILVLNIIHAAYSDHILSCNITDIEPCLGSHQRCNGNTNECVCEKGFTFVGKDCVVPSDGSSSHGATVAVVTVFTLALIGCGLFLVIRKYNLIEYIQQKINLRRNNDVMYEDVMIGQDDPPLSP